MDQLLNVNICRLCFGNKHSLLDIFESTEVNITDVITKHIGEVTKTDIFPKYVCTLCLDKVSTFHEFYCDVHAAQQHFIENLVKNEKHSNNDNIDDSLVTTVMNEVDENPSICHIVVKPDEEYSQHESIEDEVVDETNDEYSDDEMDLGVMGHEPSVELENMDIDEDISEEESSSCSEGNGRRKQRYERIDKTTIAEVIEKHFNRICELCPMELKSLKHAIKHYRSEHNIDDGYLICCDRRFCKPNLLEDHVRWHLNPNVFQCKYCDIVKLTRSSLNNHESNHRNSMSFSCDECGKAFLTRSLLERHMPSHIKRNKLPCQYCSKKFADDDKLRLHMEEMHNQSIVEVTNQLKKVNEYTKTTTIDVPKLMAEYFDRKCEYCDVQFTTLEEAQYHYLDKHRISDGYFRCCDHRLKSNSIIRLHLLWHLNKGLFKCTVCGVQLDSVLQFRRHADKHYGPIKRGERVSCTECGKRCYAQYLAAHMRKHQQKTMNVAEIQSDANMRKFFDMKCDKCPLVLNSLQHAKIHYLEHGMDNGYIKCCGKEFRRLIDVKDHLLFHFNPEIFKCPECNKTFGTRSQLSGCILRHQALESGKYKCDICDRPYGTCSELKRHKKSRHEDKAEKLEQCCRAFVSKKARLEHMRRDHKTQLIDRAIEKKFICEFCAKSFARNPVLQAHIKNVHAEKANNEFQCDICKKWLKSNYSLIAHMKRHTSGQQQCPHCNRHCINLDALKQHIKRMHEIDSTFKCNLCPKAFKYDQELKDHIASHNDTRSHTCSFCPETFNWRTNKYKHQKKMHPIEWAASRNKRPDTSGESSSAK